MGVWKGMPRFVLLEHLRDGIHWDFMLEDVEGLRTWAIDAPVVTGRDLPARALATHRRIYLDYEGDIAGGRGRVRRVDAGTYRVLVWSADLVRVFLDGAQLVGEAELRQVGASSDGVSTWMFRLGNLD
jgi:DNA polymerase Ligase (LigD)